MKRMVQTDGRNPHEILAPVVHLNGTSRDELRDGYANAHTAVEQAIKVVEQASPNARDYYVQGDDAFRLARQAHIDRLTALEYVANELLALFFAVES
jgi:hypothetical protein